MTTHPIPGGWLPSVVFHDHDVYWGVMVKGGPVRVYRLHGDDPLEVVWEDAAATTNAYIRLYSDGTTLWAAYRIDAPEKICLASMSGRTWTREVLLSTVGNNPVALGYGTVAQLIPGAGPFMVHRRALAEWPWWNLSLCPGTGIAHLTPDGYVSMDDNRATVPTMLNPMRCAGLTVGEVDKTGPRCLLTDGRGGILWADSGVEWINPMCATDGQQFAVTAWHPDGEARISILNATEIVALPNAPPMPTPEATFGPKGTPTPEGTTINISSYVRGDAATWPRTGTHPMHQVIDGDRLHFVKFGDPVAYETWSIDANWIHHLEDASNPETQVFTDTRWLPLTMRGGLAHAFETGDHKAIWMRRSDCAELRRGPFSRRMWIVSAWNHFECGPDLGDRAVVCVAYDSTGGAYAEDRGVELYYFALGAGWVRWEYHRSDRVFAGASPQFDDTTRTARSDFYRFGGPAIVPALTTCAIVPIPPEVPKMKIPDDVHARIREFASVFPVPHGDGSDDWVDAALRKYWTRHLAEQLRFSFGPTWGTKARDASAPQSKESIALNDNGLHVWDMLISAGSGNPTLADDPEYHFVPEQHFIAVDPVDHLNRIPRSLIVRPALPFLASKSSFDWHIHRDMAWLAQMKREGLRTLRLVVHSVFRESGKVTPEEAIRRLRLGLEILRAEGFTTAVTFHSDTRERGDTHETVLARTIQINSVVKDFTDVVIAARLWNENSHSVEQWFACEPDFLVQLDALVDERIPLAHGASHGGDGISLIVAGGSWIAHHGDRSKTPEYNATIMAAAQERFGKRVVDDEPIGFEQNAQPGRRVNDPDWARRQAQATLDAKLGGTTYHCNAGIWAEVNRLDDVQREAAVVFATTLKEKIPEVGVTTEQIAQVFAGGWFEQISTLLGLTGSVEARRAKVHAWIAERVEMLNRLYLDIFDRPCDLEGYGSRLWLFIEHGWSEAEMRRTLQEAYDRGDR